MDFDELDNEFFESAKETLENISNQTKIITQDINELSTFINNKGDKNNTQLKLESLVENVMKVKKDIEKFKEITYTITFMSEVCPSQKNKRGFLLCQSNVVKLRNWIDNIEFKIEQIREYCND